MSDFSQSGVVPTLHRLGDHSIEELEAELELYSRRRPIALVLPVTNSDLHSPACKNIFNELSKVNYRVAMYPPRIGKNSSISVQVGHSPLMDLMSAGQATALRYSAL